MKLHYYPHPLLDARLPELPPCVQPSGGPSQDGYAADAVIRLFKGMVDLMHAERGIGLAANQCGMNHRMFVTHIPGDIPRLYINPQIVDDSGDRVKSEEGCLSFPGVRHVAERAQEVIVEAITSAEDYETGTRSRVLLEGLEAVCAQHEIDHLDGKHFGTDLSGLKRDAMRRKIGKAVRAAKRGR